MKPRARLQDPLQLEERLRRTGDRAERERGERGVGRCRVGGDTLRVEPDEADLRLRGVDALLPDAARTLRGIDREELGDLVGEVREVVTATEADLEHAAAETSHGFPSLGD